MTSLTVSELTQSIKYLLESKFSSAVSVSGEISGFSISPSGHAYFVLKDDKAKIKSVMFRMSLRNLGSYKPKNGDKVVVVGNLKVYEPDGNYQIVVRQIIYDRVGDFYKLFEETKRKLEEEGLFDESKKKSPGLLIKRIAVITSPSGAAIKDFLITLKNNNVSVEIDIFPSQVQGESAIPMIISKIIEANRFSSQYDLLLLMRGGGSLEDLSIFNDEYIARALFDSKITTMSAIGHERDFSIADFVADVRVATPTAAAEFISNINKKFMDLSDEYLFLIENKMLNKLNDYFQNLDLFLMKIDSKSPLKKFEFYKEIVFSNTEKIIFLVKKRIDFEKNKIEKNEQIILNTITSEKLKYKQIILNIFLNEIKLKMKNLISDYKNELELIENKLKLSNPENILNKGYAVIMKRDKMVTDIFDVNLDDELEIRLRNGYINSFVTGKRKK